jgi:hypothetical protein
MARRAFIISLLLAVVAAVPARILSQAASPVTTPRQQFGADIGDDYFLATYTQLEQYWQKLDRESDRMRLVDIGLTEEGRHQWMAVLTAPENFAALDRYRDISRRLSLARDIDDDQARALAAEGKAIVWIDGGLHANEVLGAQQLIELVYQLTSRSDPETLRILRDTIVLAVQSNPDGQELVANWYMREKNPQRRSLEGIPRLYQKYVGHDNNRDFYMATQAETININRVLYQQWFPQIVYDHHQSGPAGTVMFAPPFRDPVNYVFDPLLPISIDGIGAAMHARFAVEGKAGVTMRTGSTYSTWWNGGLRTTAYFHNQIGLLTETIGDPTPIDIPYVADRQKASADLPIPIHPQPWHFRQSVEYSMTANRAVLDYASRHREELLFDIYRMGKNAIERGSRDSWTPSPRVTRSRARDPQLRDPRAFVLPADQPDFPTAVRFVDALLKNGIEVLRATAPFVTGPRAYPTGSFVVKTAQAFRPHVLDMFEPQDRQDDLRAPGATPAAPYDSTGWTLAFQMGVQFERVLDGVDGPFERVTNAIVPGGTVTDSAGAAGYLFSHHQNNSFVAVNRLLGAGEDVYWPSDRTVGSADATGSMYVTARPSTLPLLRQAATDLGLSFTGVISAPPGNAGKLRPVRVGLWDRYGGSVDSGWIRWLLERYEFPFERVFASALETGDLASRYDVIIFPNDAVPSRLSRREDGTDVENVPPEYQSTSGSMTWTRTLPQLKAFVESGGTLILMGDATQVGERLGAPITNAAVARDGGGDRLLRRDEYYIPGSILQVSVDNTLPLAYGQETRADVFFDSSPVFQLEPRSTSAAGRASAVDVRKVAWFATPKPLRSGLAVGQEHLQQTVAIADVTMGKGHIAMFGPSVAFRAQSHGTFKFLFNAIFYGQAVPVARIASTGRARER